jgi:hypothetical protein
MEVEMSCTRLSVARDLGMLAESLRSQELNSGTLGIKPNT